MQERFIEEINKLHARHLAKLLSQLEEIQCPKIILEAVKRQMSFYTNDIKNQALPKITQKH